MVKVDKLNNLGLKLKEIMTDEERFESTVENFTSLIFYILLGIGIPFMIHLILQIV